MKPGFVYLRDWRFFALLSLGLLGWALPQPATAMAWYWLAAKAAAEEFFFRFFLQDALASPLRRFRGIGPLSPANLAASALFALSHLLYHQPVWALATFFPSLAFGWMWDRYHSVLPCSITHFFYNVCLFYRPF